MKRLLILCSICVLAVSAGAKTVVRYGLQLGYDQRNIRQHFVSGGAVHTKNLYGFHAGPTFDFKIEQVEGLGIKTGVFYQFTTKKLSDDLIWEADNLKAHLISQVVEVPIRVSYTYEVNKYWDVFAYAGPQVEVGIQQTDMGSYSVGDTKYKFGGNEYTGKYWVSQENGDKVTRDWQIYDYQYRQKFADLSLGFGLGFRYSHLAAAINFDWDVLNRAHKSANPKNNKIHVGVMQMSVGYVF